MTDIVELLSAKNRVADILLSNTGNFSGVGAKIKEDIVTVYLRDYTEQAKKKAYDLLKSNKANGHEIEFINSGHVTALACPTSRTTYTRPICGGMSIGRGDIGAGTFGATVFDPATSERYLLSNSHVFSGASTYQNPNANVGDIIYAPGLLDSSGIKYPIGTLHKWINMDESASNFVDCAIAKPDNPDDVSDEIIGIGKVNGWEEPVEQIQLIKSGRSSSITEGRIEDYNAVIEVDYGNILIKFTNCIVSPAMGIAGDSGSLLINKNNNNAVGLLFAGSDTITVGNRISYVLQQLNVTITPNGTVPTPQYEYSTNDINYNLQAFGITALGAGVLVSVLPTIEQQFQLWMSRKVL